MCPKSRCQSREDQIQCHFGSEFPKKVRFSTTHFKYPVTLEGGQPTKVSLSSRVCSHLRWPFCSLEYKQVGQRRCLRRRRAAFATHPSKRQTFHCARNHHNNLCILLTSSPGSTNSMCHVSASVQGSTSVPPPSFPDPFLVHFHHLNRPTHHIYQQGSKTDINTVPVAPPVVRWLHAVRSNRNVPRIKFPL